MKMRDKLFFLFFIIFFLIINIKTIKADSIGVSPGRLNFDNYNENIEEITIYNPNDDDFEFKIYSEPFSWIIFEPEKGKIEPYGNKRVNAVLSVPEKTRAGEYETLIYIIPIKDEDNKTVITAGAAVKAKIIIKNNGGSNIFIGIGIIVLIILCGIVLYKKNKIVDIL